MDTTNTKNLTFGEAVEALKQGRCVRRAGWNGKGMFVCRQVPATITGKDVISKMTSLPDDAKKMICAHGQIQYVNQLLLVTKNFEANSWTASSSDILSEDWEIITFPLEVNDFITVVS